MAIYNGLFYFMTRLQLVKEAIEEHTINGKSILSKKKLGELLHYRHPQVFSDAESARTDIRRVTGASGKWFRDKIRTTIQWNGFQLPEPEKNDYSKFIIKEKRIGILSDIHFPYYDKNALDIAINHLIKWSPDCIILNGDTIDMYQCSNFERDPRQRSPKYEFDLVREFLDQLSNIFKGNRLIYKLGNHDERYEKKILQRLPEFIDLQWFSIDFALKYQKDYKIDIVRDKRIIMAGGLNILHGHETARGFIAPVNVARGFYLKAKANIIAGHHHRVSEHLETDINGKTIGAWSTGCLCELHPHYMPINNWQHGFAMVEVDGEDFEVHNKKILNGKVR